MTLISIVSFTRHKTAVLDLFHFPLFLSNDLVYFSLFLIYDMVCFSLFHSNDLVYFFSSSVDTIGNTLKIDGPGEVFYVHCDMTKEEQIKVKLFMF